MNTQRQSVVLVVFSIIILVLFIVYGFPAMLNISGEVATKFSKKSKNEISQTLTPSVPRFSQDFEATKSAEIKITGVADARVTVEVWQNEQSLGTTIAKDDGRFSMEVDLVRGNNVFVAQATSETGQKSSKSQAYSVSYLSKGPKLEITTPKDGDNFNQATVIVSGTTDPGASVAVNDHLAFVSNTGDYSYNLNLTNGENKIKVVATDKAGNQTAKELTLSTTIP